MTSAKPPIGDELVASMREALDMAKADMAKNAIQGTASGSKHQLGIPTSQKIEIGPQGIAIPADPTDPEDFDVTFDALKRAWAERAGRLKQGNHRKTADICGSEVAGGADGNREECENAHP